MDDRIGRSSKRRGNSPEYQHTRVTSPPSQHEATGGGPGGKRKPLCGRHQGRTATRRVDQGQRALLENIDDVPTQLYDSERDDIHPRRRHRCVQQ